MFFDGEFRAFGWKTIICLIEREKKIVSNDQNEINKIRTKIPQLDSLS